MPYKRKQKGLARWVGQVQLGGVRKTKLFTTKAEAIAWEVQTRDGQGMPPKELSPEINSDSSISLVQWAEEYLTYSLKFDHKTILEKHVINDKDGVHLMTIHRSGQWMDARAAALEA